MGANFWSRTIFHPRKIKLSQHLDTHFTRLYQEQTILIFNIKVLSYLCKIFIL